MCKSILFLYFVYFSSDITDKRNWEEQNMTEYQDSPSHSALPHVTWGICDTESDYVYGEVENRLDLLQEQLNR